jgi:hypothetical protein
MNPEQTEELNYYRGLRFLLLARSYEAQENKNYAVLFYKEALRHNGASYEAFNRLISNHLLTREEKKVLVASGEDGTVGVITKGLEGRPEDLWLKDYYTSRIEQQVKTAQEAEGFVMVRASQPLNSTSLMVNNVSRGHDGMSSGGGSGLMSSPSRFQHDLLLENEDENE